MVLLLNILLYFLFGILLFFLGAFFVLLFDNPVNRNIGFNEKILIA